MKQKILLLLLKISKNTAKLYYRFSDTVLQDLDYSSLSPIDNGDEKGHYSNALKWALKNRKKKDIKNVALTGPYGSGKSTILKTFQKNYTENDLTFLNISLATFKEEKIKRDKDGNIIAKEKEDRLRLIETSILQQIFYHEEDKDIPDSRFKKIKSYSNQGLIGITIGTLLFILALLNIFHPVLIERIFEVITLPDFLNTLFPYANILVIVFGITFIIFKSVRVISSVTVNKLKFQNAEIEIAESPNKSILNHHLDEILYFFSVTPYNVVVIEDLDRFQETEIFTKLREINLLLNNSKKTEKKGIVFIYAVRDDMFSDNERIKFFDFIIPVIPVINSSNSSEILLRKKNNYGYNLSESFIENLAFFIDDMRLLHNVTNEFYLYLQKHGDTPLSEEKLFAIIAYKNIHPNDFVKLSRNDGFLYKVLVSKNIYIQDEIKKINQSISKVKEELKILESLSIKNIRELRLIYLAILLEEMQGTKGFQSYVINDKKVSINDLTKEENFEYFKNNELKYIKLGRDYYGNSNYQTTSLPIEFESLEKNIDTEKDYDTREAEINALSSNKSSSLKKRIQELEEEKIKKQNLKISDLANLDIDLNYKLEDEINKELISVLIKNGYIAEDYFDYISLFHGESITRSDHQFLISTRNKQALDFDFKLNKTEKIVSKLNALDFSSDYTLNFDLINFILQNKNSYSVHIEFIFRKLKDESSKSLEFINRFFDRNENLESFTYYLSKYWKNLWYYYVNDNSCTDNYRRMILKYLILYSDIDSLKIQAENSTLRQNILSDPDFLLLLSDIEKIKRTIEALGLRLKKINFKDSPEELVKYVYENNWYELTKENIIAYLKRYDQFDQVIFDNSNYKLIRESNADLLKARIEDEINVYLENIYFKIDTNINEDQKFLIRLLNKENVAFTNKKKLINQVVTKIKYLDDLNEDSVKDQALIKNKLDPTWENLLIVYSYSEDNISKPLVDFLSDLDNAKLLSETKISNEKDSDIDFSAFTKAFLNDNRIENDAYEYLTKSVPWWYTDFEIDQLDSYKVTHLIQNSVLQPNITNFNSLKSKHTPLHIKMLERFKNKYFKKLDELELDGDDLEKVLKSSQFNHLEKNTILNTCSNEVLTSNLVVLEEISSLLVRHDNFEINSQIIELILLSRNISVSNRIKIYATRLEDKDERFIERFLTSLGKEYEKILRKDKKAKIPKNISNELLLKTLVRQKYISSFSNGITSLQVNHWRKRK